LVDLNRRLPDGGMGCALKNLRWRDKSRRQWSGLVSVRAEMHAKGRHVRLKYVFTSSVIDQYAMMLKWLLSTLYVIGNDSVKTRSGTDCIMRTIQ